MLSVVDRLALLQDAVDVLTKRAEESGESERRLRRILEEIVKTDNLQLIHALASETIHSTSTDAYRFVSSLKLVEKASGFFVDEAERHGVLDFLESFGSDALVTLRAVVEQHRKLKERWPGRAE